MLNENSTLSILEKIFLYIEIGLIIAFVTFTSLELSLSFSSYNDISDASYLYYFDFLNNRIVPDKYLSDIKLLDKTEMDNIYIKSNGKAFCDSNFHSHRFNFMKIGEFSNANLTDVTNQTIKMHAEFGKKTTIIDNENVGFKFYNIDMRNKGNSDISLATNYEFNMWKGYGFCVTDIYIVNPKAISFVDKDKTCENALKSKVDYETYFIDCKVYNNIYRVCLDSNLLKFDNGELLYEYFKSNSNIDMTNYCPYNNLKIDFIRDENKSNGYSYTLNTIKGVDKIIPSTNKSDSIDLSGFLLINMRNSTVNPMYVTSPNNNTYYEPTNFDISKHFGIHDKFVKVIDTDNFNNFYNQSFYIGPNKNNTHIIDYNPEYLEESLKSFYFPYDDNTKYDSKLIVSVIMDAHEFIDSKCYSEFYKVKKDYYYYDFLSSFKVGYFIEVITNIIPWEIVKLFYGVFWLIRIRFLHILDMIKLRMNAKDKESETVSKFSGKMLIVVVFCLLLYGVNFLVNNLNIIVIDIDILIDSDCFTNPLFISSLNEYKKLCESEATTLRTLLNFCILSLVFEVTALLMYIILWSRNLKKNITELKNNLKTE